MIHGAFKKAARLLFFLAFGLAILALVLASNLASQGMRDAFDPGLRA